MKNKALVLGANYYISLSIIRCLGENGIHVTAVDYAEKGSYAFKSKYLSEKLIAPHYKEDPEGLLKFLIEYAKKQEKKPVLFASADPYVEFVDKYLNQLREYYLMSQTEQGLFTKIMNKGTLGEFAKKLGTPIPETISPDEENFLSRVAAELKYPCLVKPEDSAAFVKLFRKKLFIADNEKELIEALKKAENAQLEVIIQRIIPGFDDHMYTFDAHLDQNSKVTHWLTCQKLRQYPINYGASVYTQQKYVKKLYEIGKPFLEGIGWKGFAEIEFKKDAITDKFYMIEVNVRTTNLNVLLEKAGINMPLVAYKELVGEDIQPKAIEEDKNIVFWYAYEDFHAVRGYIKEGQMTAMGAFKSYFRPKAHAIWDFKDPMPFFSFLNKHINQFVNRRIKRKK